FPDRGIVRSIAWNPATHLSCSDCEDPIANPLENSLYEVTVTDTNGCTAVQRIRILIDQPQVWVPNAFSPNGDQINDLVWIHGSQEEVTRIRTFQIFDRWGNRVFENKDFKPNDQSTGWDGSYQSQKCSPGVFVYWAEVELINGESWIIKGDISLIR
ncbi:MAG TPA: gliding motility-associated C-terminal domain-containing protein, partial [Saprospiraceae bacterium]|nr:gliding motility-associated C-terminal domain-containing protein [Saprospiraceae bacterium]